MGMVVYLKMDSLPSQVFLRSNPKILACVLTSLHYHLVRCSWSRGTKGYVKESLKGVEGKGLQKIYPMFS
jgi:hypothetical protein